MRATEHFAEVFGRRFAAILQERLGQPWVHDAAAILRAQVVHEGRTMAHAAGITPDGGEAAALVALSLVRVDGLTLDEATPSALIARMRASIPVARSCPACGGPMNQVVAKLTDRMKSECSSCGHRLAYQPEDSR